AVTGRPGPVLIDLPKNIMTAQTNLSPAAEIHIRGYVPSTQIDEEAVRLIASKIESSERPVLVVGGGAVASGAAEPLFQLVETAQIPVATTLMGIGAFPARH
ncbi:acetolactate synthase large subunit, partial [Paenibacillus barengoltzii]|nr:acetolactate synthase large subunit [Paenibacillus barengoltzii]